MKPIIYKITDPPPSLNATKRIVMRGKTAMMADTRAYRDWFKAASLELLTQTARLPDPCYWSSEILIPASKTKADLDNLPKAIHDLLVKSERVPDDRYMVGLRVKFWNGGHVAVAVKQEELAKWAPIKNPSRSTLELLQMGGDDA